MNTFEKVTFPHQRLEAYRVALQMAAAAYRLSQAIPRGHRSLADHLLRAATNAVLLLAEGADRRGAGEKRQRFNESRGECGEVAAASEVVAECRIAPLALAAETHELAARTAAMLTGLILRNE